MPGRLRDLIERIYNSFTATTEYVPSTPENVESERRATSERRHLVDNFVGSAATGQMREVMHELRQMIDVSESPMRREVLVNLLDRLEQEDFRRHQGLRAATPRNRDGDWYVADSIAPMSVPQGEMSNYQWDVTTTTTPNHVPQAVDTVVQDQALNTLKGYMNERDQGRLSPEDTGIAENGEVVMPEGFARGAKLSQDSFFHGAAQCPECNNTFKIGDTDHQLVCTQCSHEFERPNRIGYGEKIAEDAFFQNATAAATPHTHTGLGVAGQLTVASTPGNQQNAIGSADPHNHGMAGNFVGYSTPNSTVGYSSGNSPYRNTGINPASAGAATPNSMESATSSAIQQKMANLAKSIHEHQLQSVARPEENQLVPFMHVGGNIQPAQVEEIAETMETGPWQHPVTGTTAKQPPEII